MKYMKIGQSGIEASVITLGAFSMGGGNWWPGYVDDVSVRTIHRALELGVNIIDTAPIYGLGHSEEVVGRAIKGRREKYVISTKGTFAWDTGIGVGYKKEVDGHKIFVDHKYESIIRDCENSLKRLDTDYIDVYYLHNPAKDTSVYPVSETARALTDLQKQGKIRAIGISNANPDQVLEYLATGCRVDILQRKYSILQRDVEKTLIPLCREKGISFHGYEPIERGIFTGTASKDYKLKEGESRNDTKWWSPERLPATVDFVDGLKEIAAKYDGSTLSLAIAFLRGSGEFVNVICGARKPEQIEADAPAADVQLSAADLAEIRKRAEALEAMFE